MASSNAENSTTLISVKIAETDFLQSVPKNVLMKYSEVFGRMFQREEWLESQSNTLTLNDCTPEALQLVLRLIDTIEHRAGDLEWGVEYWRNEGYDWNLDYPALSEIIEVNRLFSEAWLIVQKYMMADAVKSQIEIVLGKVCFLDHYWHYWGWHFADLDDTPERDVYERSAEVGWTKFLVEHHYEYLKQLNGGLYPDQLYGFLEEGLWEQAHEHRWPVEKIYEQINADDGELGNYLFSLYRLRSKGMEQGDKATAAEAAEAAEAERTRLHRCVADLSAMVEQLLRERGGEADGSMEERIWDRELNAETLRRVRSDGFGENKAQDDVWSGSEAIAFNESW